jgi:hypothetical protein
MAAKLEPPFHPIVYVRGYAGSQGEVEETVATPYMGFNLGATKVRQRWDGAIVRASGRPRAGVAPTSGRWEGPDVPPGSARTGRRGCVGQKPRTASRAAVKLPLPDGSSRRPWV